MRFFIGFSLCLCFVFTNSQIQATEAAEQNLKTLELDTRTLAGVLHLYQRAGYDIIFSSRLVSDSLVVDRNPQSGEPIERLQSILRGFNLSLQFQEETHSWFVVASNTRYRTLTFSITDSHTGLPIVDAVVQEASVENSKSDEHGLLTLTIDTATLPCVQISRPMYNDICAEFSNSTAPIPVKMSKAKISIEEIIVTSQYRFDASRIDSTQTFDIVEIQSAPTLGGDPLQIINSLPGIASQGFSAKPNIRGGAQDELLVLFDDIELIDPFHLKDYQNLLSGISSDLVDTIAIHTGGYPATYGGKMSGVMEIQSPRLPEHYSNSLAVTPFTTALKTSGADEDESFAWMLAARRGILDETLERVNENLGAPYFDDLYLSTRWRFEGDTHLETSYLAFRDDVSLTSLDGDVGEALRSIYNSKYGWLKLDFTQGENLDHRLTLTVADIKNYRNGFVNEPDIPSESVGELMDNRVFHLNRFEFNTLFQPSSTHNLEAGIKLEYLEGDYDYHLQAQRGELANLLGIPREIAREVEAHPSGSAGSLFLSYRYVPSEVWSIETGIRADAQNYYEKEHLQLSPRSALKLAINEKLHAKVNIGRFYQAPGINELNIESGSPIFHEPQKSDHYILGLGYDLSSAFSFTIEVYRKDVFSPRPRFENVFHPYVFIPDIAADRILISPQYAEIRGYEALFEYKNYNGFRAWASYTRSETKDELENNVDLSRAWNQKHTVQGGLTWLGKSWTLGTRLHWHSGWRATLFPAYVDNLNTPISYDLYGARLPNFLSLDLKASYFWTGKNSQLETFIEITNVSDFENIGYYELEITENEDLGGFDIETEQNALLPLVPSIGVSWRF